jgi:hypothetical protein
VAASAAPARRGIPRIPSLSLRPLHGLSLLGVLWFAPTASAQERLTIPLLDGPVQLDGLSDEPAWQALAPIGMVMFQPTHGDEPTERTEFRVAHDGQYLYVAARMYDSDPGGIRATSLRRDDGSLTNDWFAFNLDTFEDGQDAVSFAVTPAGVRTDLTYNDPRAAINFNWNTFWDAAVRRTPEGWFAELRIPFSSLRFQDADGEVRMGMSAWRGIARKSEVSVFPAIPDQWGFVGVLKATQMQPVRLVGVRSRRPLYATPYLLGGAGHTTRLNGESTAYARAPERVRDAGLDLKYGITSNLTLDLTANTDFAQVEADDQQVNLTRFSLFFPEKRQFFQDRASVFEFATGGNDRLFYSRRIGLAGGRPVPLHGGARLVGRVGEWDVGLLTMRSGAVEGLAAENFGVLRVRRPVLNSSSAVGGILTTRSGATDNLVYGLDGLLRIRGEDYLTLNWAQSFTEDRGSAGGAVDRALLRARWERRGIDQLRYALAVSRVGSAFDPALGYQQRGDFLRLGDRISYGWRGGRESRLRRHALQLEGNAYLRNSDGSTESAALVPGWRLETKSGHEFAVSAAMQHEDLRSGFSLAEGVTVPVGVHRFRGAALQYVASDARLRRAGATLEAGQFYDGTRVAMGVTPTWNVSRHLELGGAYQVDRVEFRDRGQLLTAHVARLRTRVMLDTRLSGAAFVQYNSASNAISTNLRLRYNPREGNDLYLVYNEGLNTDRFGFDPVRPFSETRTLLIKYSHTVDLGF